MINRVDVHKNIKMGDINNLFIVQSEGMKELLEKVTLQEAFGWQRRPIEFKVAENWLDFSLDLYWWMYMEKEAEYTNES